MSELPVNAIILAAGAGTRMKSNTSKVLHPILGRPIIGYVLAAVKAAGAADCCVVVGHCREQVGEYLARFHPDVLVAVQSEQRGTGHAVQCALADRESAEVAPADRPILVIAGDQALVTAATLRRLVQVHTAEGSAVTMVTAIMDDPAGYGRIIRGADDGVDAIVEERDATAEQCAVAEVNTSIYSFDPRFLKEALSQLTTDNSQGELYLTDVVEIARSGGRRVSAVVMEDPSDAHGINDRAQLATVTRLMARRINDAQMRAGVTMLDPETTWIEPEVRLQANVVIERNSYLGGQTKVEAGAVIGPDTTLIDCQVGVGATVLRSHCVQAIIGADARVGPFAYLRSGAELRDQAKAGAYVEIKNSVVGAGSKVPHLTYVGDAEIGAGSNIGAATVFVNYDGVAKHRTVVGSQVRIGSDTMLVAPVRVGDGAYTAAGSVVTEDVPAGAMAIGRSRQVNLLDWVLRRRPGTKSAAAAAAAAAPAATAGAAGSGAAG